MWCSQQRAELLRNYRGYGEKIYHVTFPIESDLLCATAIRSDCFVIGTRDGKVHICSYDEESLEMEIKLTYTFETILEENPVSVNIQGRVVALSAHDANHVLVIENDKLLKSVRTDNIMLPINASFVENAGNIVVATSAWYDSDSPEYAFVLDTEVPVGKFEVNEGNDELYCEVIKPYTGEDTEYFKNGKLYGQFRRWDKKFGYIHTIDENTGPESAYKVPMSQIPLIFDFVTNDQSLVLITNSGVIIHIDLEKNQERRRWTTTLWHNVMPGISCHQNVAFVKTSTLGSKWEECGTDMPKGSRLLTTAELAKALKEKKEFTCQEWEEFGIKDLQTNDVVKVGSEHFKPVASTNTIIHLDNGETETTEAKVCVKVEKGLVLIKSSLTK